MNLKSNLRLKALGAVTAFGLLAPGAGQATTYTDNFTVDPTQFSCGYYVDVEICGSFSLYTGGPRFVTAGDQFNEIIQFTSLVAVPATTTSNAIYTTLPNNFQHKGPNLPGPLMAHTTSTLLGYLGPAGPYTTYTSNGLHEYVASSGFFGVANPGFSATGIVSNYSILTSDANPNYGVSYGFVAALPATPTVLSSFNGGTVGHPALLPAGLIGAISSDISGGKQTSDFYDFRWSGGLFQTVGSIANANPLADFHFQLFDAYTGVKLDDLLLYNGNNFSDTISTILPAGGYEIGMYTNSPFDPQFTISFNTPVAGIPEPNVWALMLVGFGGLGAAARARRRLERQVG